MAATSLTGDSLLFLVDYLLRLVRVAVLLSIWRIVMDGRGPVSGMTLSAVLTYTLVSEVFADQLTPRTHLEEALWEGTIATRMLQPMNMVGQFAAEMWGQWTVSFGLFSLPLLLLSPLLGVDPRPAGWGAAALFAVSLLLAMSVGLALEFIFGGLVVAMQESVWLVAQVRRAVTLLLSGAVLPLALLPWGLGSVFQLLPFASLASTPLKLYTGTGDPLLLLLLQVAWSVLLWPFAGWLWRRYRERLASHGG
jgi:ABC-2 type transport system permease protein